MSDPNIPSNGEYSEHSQEALDNQLNNERMKKQAKMGKIFRKYFKRMRKVFSRRGSSPQDKSVMSGPASLCCRYPESRTGLQHWGTAMSMPTLNDGHQRNSIIPVDELYVGTSASGLPTNGEQSHSDPLDLFENSSPKIDISLLDLCERFRNWSFHDIMSDCVAEKHNCLDETSPRCFDAVDKRVYDNSLFMSDSTVAGLYSGEGECKVKAPSNNDEDAAPGSQKEHNLEFSKMSTGGLDERKIKAMSEGSISTDDDGSETDYDYNRGQQERNMEHSRAKESLPCLPTGNANESIEKIPLEETTSTIDDSHSTNWVNKHLLPVSSMQPHPDDRFDYDDIVEKAEDDHVNVGYDIVTGGWTARDSETLLPVSDSVINVTGECDENICEDNTGNHVPISPYFKEQELQEMSNGSKAINLDENFDLFFQPGNRENLRNISQEFSKQDQAQTQLLESVMNWIGEREVGQYGNNDNVADVSQQYARNYDVKRTVDGKNKNQYGIDGGPKFPHLIAIPTGQSPDRKLNQPTCSLKKRSYQPIMNQTSNSLGFVGEFLELQKSADNIVASNTSLDDSQDSNFAMKSGATYQERPEIETKRALPVHHNPISRQINKPQLIQAVSTEAFTSLGMNLMDESQEHHQVHQTPINLIKPEKKHHAGGARRKQTIHPLPNQKPATQGRHLNATDSQLGISFTPDQNMSNNTDSRKQPMTSDMPADFSINMVTDMSANQKSDKKNWNFQVEISPSSLSQMDLPPLPPSSLNLGPHLRASVDESKASPGMDDNDQDNINLTIYNGTNNGYKLLSPLNDGFHNGVDEAANILLKMPSNASICEDGQQPSHHEWNTMNGTTTLSQPTLTSSITLNRRPTVEFSDGEQPMNFQSDALLCTETPVVECVDEFLQTEHTESVADFGVGDTEFCSNVPQSSPSDLQVTVNSHNFPQAVTQQDEAVKEISSANSSSSSLHSESVMDCNEISGTSTSLGMTSNEEMPSTSSYHTTLDESHNEFCEPDHRSRRESITPEYRRSSQRCFTTDQPLTTSQNAESVQFVEDEDRLGRETPIPVSSEHSTLPQAEYDAIPFVNFEPDNENGIGDGFLSRSLNQTREIELENRIIPRCCPQCKGSVDRLFEENQRQICEDCKRSNKRNANHPNGNFPRWGICFSCKQCAITRNWKRCGQCSNMFCTRSCRRRHAIHCQPKAFVESVGPE